MRILIQALLLTILCASSWAATNPDDLKYYRNLTLNIRTEAMFKVPMIGTEPTFNYKLEIGAPIYPEPLVSDVKMGDPEKTYRSFWDRVFLKDGSYIIINGEQIPLTCIFVSGQDNRLLGSLDPRFPQLIMKIYLVANDYTCTGPINPGFPENGGKKEMWDTYLRYEVKDPTIMLPVDAMIRYRWNEASAVLVK